MLLVSLVHNSEVFIKPGNVTAVLLFESNHHCHNHNVIKKTPTPQTGSLDAFCLDSWQITGCHSQMQNNYLLACYFIWLPKSGLFYTEPWKNTLHLLKENNISLDTLYNKMTNLKRFGQELL